ncbi:sigma-54-dependent transcriptional regulator [Crenalkalicoccus roseus]|uniref:sigma-54-dependent transcriptional regulator n=1 Tax=Crenalkalicoccus roseus TaxID=1485588 RepID=UPI001082216E|nr:sigma-54 dependent transcriptional regulator [Crenalkalicoccus roseus]
MSAAAGHEVVLIEDDEVLGASLVQRLRLEGVGVRWARTLAEGEALLRRGPRPSLVLCDMRLPDGSGEELLLRLMPELGAVPVVAMTAYGGIAQAVRLVRAGADDYLPKPFPVEAVLDKLATLAPPAGDGAGAAPPRAGEEEAPGWRSPPMRALRAAVARLARVTTPVLLLGESGAGKEVAARALHALGPRAAEPFVALNCAAIPRDLLESEVFGHERGAFTGAAERRLGAAERAGRGTLLLDEVAELDPALQAKLLRLIEDRRFLRVGGSREVALEARLLAATNADLQARVAEGRFRGDLYFRLAVVELRVPPLRERPEDVRDLALLFLAEAARAAGREGMALSPAAEDALLAHAWPGNARELRNRIERAAVLAEHAVLEPADLFPERGAAAAGGADLSLAAARDAAEREHIRRVLARCGGRVGDAARALGVSRTTLWERMRRLGVPGS